MNSTEAFNSGSDNPKGKLTALKIGQIKYSNWNHIEENIYIWEDHNTSLQASFKVQQKCNWSPKSRTAIKEEETLFEEIITEIIDTKQCV